jgi:UDP-N-acetyl-D-mannosaminuronic acid transferase (WecB/TagA/CpsF family)
MIVSTTNGSRPDLLIAGSSIPLQQAWVRENIAGLEVPFGALDYGSLVIREIVRKGL